MKKGVKDYLFVSIQFLLFALFVFVPHRSIYESTIITNFWGITLILGGIIVMILSFIALNKNLSAFPTPLDNAELIQVGVYKKIRHPIYTSILMLTLGYSLFTTNAPQFITFALLLVLFYFKSSYEELLLNKKYSNYSIYKQKTGRFLPINFKL